MVNNDGRNDMDESRWSLRWLLVTAALCIALAASASTGLYEYLGAGTDLSWLAIITFAAAPLALGVSWPLPAAFAVTLLGGVVGFAIAAGSDDPWLAFGVAFYAVAALLVIAVGRLVTAGLRRAGLSRWGETRTAAVLLALSFIPLAVSLQRSTWDKVPAAEARSLPLEDDYLANLCYSPSRGERARLQYEARALVKSTRTHPGWIVRTSSSGEDGTSYSRRTVRQLAQDQLRDLEHAHCQPALRQALRDAIGK